MTPDQIDRAKQILEEELALTQKSQWIKNGEDFPDLATLALEIPGIANSIEGGAMLIMMMLALDRGGVIERLQKNKSDPGSLARDPIANTSALDLLWLGYRLGRRMEQEEIMRVKMYETTKL
jgi:hypothetical protein